MDKTQANISDGRKKGLILGIFYEMGRLGNSPLQLVQQPDSMNLLAWAGWCMAGSGRLDPTDTSPCFTPMGDAPQEHRNEVQPTLTCLISTLYFHLFFSFFFALSQPFNPSVCV